MPQMRREYVGDGVETNLFLIKSSQDIHNFWRAFD